MDKFAGIDAARERLDREDVDLASYDEQLAAPPVLMRVNVSEAPEGSELLDDVERFLARFVSYPTVHARFAHVLWVAHSHAMSRWDSTPRLAFLSPEPGSGKTRALEVTALLVPREVEAINATPAYLFRKISGDEEGTPTILFDEIDTIFGPKAKKDNEELRGVINAGHRKGAVAGRCVIRGKEVHTEELPAYCAVALAGLGDLPDTILTRSVIIRMRRRAPTEQVEPFRRRLQEAAGHELRGRLAVWAERTLLNSGDYPDMPDGIVDRAADVWEPLLTVADAAGGRWPGLARVSCVTHVTESMRETPSLGIRLLSDLRTLFGGRSKLLTTEILEGLIGVDDSPWGDLKGKPLNSRGLSRMLDRYGVVRTTMRLGAHTGKGYTTESLYEAWQRYLPQAPQESVTSVTTGTSSETEELLL